jgi:integrase
LVFPNGIGRPHSANRLLEHYFYPLQIAAGMVKPARRSRTKAVEPKYAFHALRHFAASYFIDLGFEPKRVQALMGHASIQMTFDRYGHLFPKREDDYARLAAGRAALLGK